MKQYSYQDQWNKLTTAYVNGKVQPQDPCCCFIGNLLNNASGWIGCRTSFGQTYASPNITLFPRESGLISERGLECIQKQSGGLYTPKDIIAMEQLFLRTVNQPGDYEENLFKAFCVTLDLLKDIHIAAGEVIDESPVFVKRELKTV
jgi:hypothetical protein